MRRDRELFDQISQILSSITMFTGNDICRCTFSNDLTATITTLRTHINNPVCRFNDVEIVLKPLHFNDFGNETDTSSDTTSEDTTQDVSTNNIEEKVEE